MNPKHNSANNKLRAQLTKSKKGYHAVSICPPVVLTAKNGREEDQDKLNLLELIALNDIEKCKHLLNMQIDLQKKDKNFLSQPLFRAAKNGHYKIMDLLLEKRADINVQLGNDSSALHLAIRHHHEQCSITLLQKGIKFKELQDGKGNLAIHLAASEGMIEVAKLMLDNGQNLNVKNKKEQTPLHLALMKKDNKELIQLLLNYKSCSGSFDIKDCNLRLPLHYAVDNSYEFCCDQLLERNPEHAISSDSEGDTPLILSAQKGWENFCKSLCTAVAKSQLNVDGLNKVNKLGNTALHYASVKGHIKIIRMLIEFKVDYRIKDKKGNSAMHISAIHKDLESFNYLTNCITTFPGVNCKKESILHLAVLNNWAGPIKSLIEKNFSYKININLQDDQNRTALHLATLYSNEECIDILLQNGANFSLLDEELNTPLHLAARNGLLKACEWILQGEGTKMINLKNKGGETPLHLAASNDTPSCCDLLLHKGACIHEINNEGFSPYQVSAAKGKLDNLKLFTKYKRSLIKPKVEGSDDTILDIAARNGHYECCEFILGIIGRNLILSSLYVAFDMERDEIFRLILPRCILSNDKKAGLKFQAKLHNFMHKALAKEQERPVIQIAIIESDWWFSGFSSCFCEEGQCGNFFNLTKSNPEFARFVLDRCIINFEGVDVYDFRLLEQDFYIKLPDASKSTGLMVAPPYNLETGEFLQESLRHKHSIGYKESALNEAIENGSRNVIQHPLIDGYWEYKWKKYLKYVLMGLLLLHVLITAALGLYLLHSWNWTQVNAALQNLNIKLQKVDATPIPYNILRNCSGDLLRVLELPEVNFPFLNFLRIHLAILAIISFYVDYQMFNKFNFKSYMTLGVILRNFRLVLIVFLILPMTSCYDQIGIMMTWQWLSGIIALLMSWFHVIYTLNKFPSLSVFMPITSKFAKSFFLVLLYILLIVLVFSFIFYLLFNNHPAFANLGIAFVKSIVWIVGDLAYDDMFLDEEKPILYFAFSNVIFIVFVTSISGFIVNLIITQPTEKFQSFESDAAWNRDSSRIKMLVKLDNWFRQLRKGFTIIFWAKGKEADMEFMSRLMKYYQEEKILPPKTKLKPKLFDSESGDLSKQIEILISEVKQLKKNFSDK